jgi:2-amino-4-hydroxy-6-hydroxymethyldihydropteridine diphosphokinase
LAFKHQAYIGVGSNLGEKVDNCRQAIAAIAVLKGCLLDGVSPLYETEPVGVQDQSFFVNAVALVKTDLEPVELLERLRAIETSLGRKPGGKKFGPRVLDLDILFFDNVILRSDRIEIPHPRLHERRFVLEPLCDLAAELVHPVLGKTVRFLLADLKDGKKVVRLAL